MQVAKNEAPRVEPDRCLGASLWSMKQIGHYRNLELVFKIFVPLFLTAALKAFSLGESILATPGNCFLLVSLHSAVGAFR